MTDSTLSDNQRRVLDSISGDARITDAFYLSGGTALAEYYLHHRLSEDLDFFSEFDHHLDPLQLAAQFTKADTLKDFPRMIIDVPESEWIPLFLKEAQRLAKSQLS